MSAEDRDLKQFLIGRLAEHGILAENVPESVEPTPDLLAVDSGGERYAIEVKSRPQSWVDGATALRGGGHLRRDPTGRSPALEKVFKTAARQLQSKVVDNALRIIWFIADPSDRRFHYERIRATAYGIRIVAPLKASMMEGYYTTYASFATFRECIDGVLVGDFAALFINDLAVNVGRLRGSALAATCGSAVVDPVAREAAGGCYRLSPGDWKPSPEESRKRLNEKYGIDVVELVDLTRFSAGS